MHLLLVLAIMWLPVIVAYTVLFSVGEGIGPKKQAAVHPMPPPKPAPETHHVPHAA